jgi:hypothetical protein
VQTIKLQELITNLTTLPTNKAPPVNASEILLNAAFEIFNINTLSTQITPPDVFLYTEIF